MYMSIFTKFPSPCSEIIKVSEELRKVILCTGWGMLVCEYSHCITSPGHLWSDAHWGRAHLLKIITVFNFLLHASRDIFQ